MFASKYSAVYPDLVHCFHSTFRYRVEGIPSDVVLATSLRDALSILASDQYSKDVESVYLIGGSAAYCEAFDPKADLPCANIYLTRVHSPVDCDVFIPEIPDSLFVLDEMLVCFHFTYHIVKKSYPFYAYK